MTSSSFSRRDLLKAGGALIVSFALGDALPRPAHAQELPRGPLDLSEVDSFIAVHTDGSVTIYTSHVDVGTGLRIAAPQMVAEELSIPVERVRIVEGDTATTPDHGGTGGSTGIPRGAVDLRQAAATAHQALLRLGADRLKWPVSELVLADGQVRPSSGGPGVSIGALVGDKPFSLKMDAKAPLKNPATYSLVGKPLPRPDVPGKCTGRHTYVQDQVVPGMLHGRVIRPPAIGAKLQSVDESSIRAIPDVRIVREGD